MIPAMRSGRQIAWVTGASRGLGRSVAAQLAAAGYSVVVTARDPERLERTAAAIQATAPDGVEVVAQPGSIREDQDVLRVVEYIRDRWGRLDALVCNAGISPVYTPSDRLSVHDWQRIIDTNLTGVFRCCRYAVELMKGGGAIVNVSSIHGQVGAPNLAAYAASKGGVDALTRTLAVEWAPRGIRVNAVAPGYLETDMTAGLRSNDRYRTELLRQVPMGRFGSVDEVAAMIVALCGGQGSYVTGTVMTIDGGWTAR